MSARPRPSWWNAAVAASATSVTRSRLLPTLRPPLALDDARRRPKRRSSFEAARIGEAAYARRLRALAAHVGEIVDNVYDPEDPGRTAALAAGSLRAYAKTLDPWARAVAHRMLTDVSSRDAQAWRDQARTIGFELGREMLGEIATATIVRARLEEQVRLITSLPEEAAARVMAQAHEGLAYGRRADEIAEAILATGHVTRSRANLIARTEVGRAASEVTRARAEYIGSDGYIWRSVGDADVRHRHQELEGTFHRWNEPPIAGERGEKYHAGAGPNCRCWSEPLLARR